MKLVCTGIVSLTFCIIQAPAVECLGSNVEAFNIQLEQTIFPSVNGSRFGSNIAVSDDVAIFGAGGFAEIHRFQRGQWTPEAILEPSHPAGHYASDVDFDGSVAIVGDTQNALTYIYRYDGVNWLEEAKLTVGWGNGGYGSTVAIDGNHAVVGAAGGRGTAYVYKYDAGRWSEEQRLTPRGLADRFGASVDISGNTILVGSPGTDSAFFYEFKDNFWQERQQVGVQAVSNHHFGSAVALNGNRAVIGSWADSHVGAFAGSAYIYDRTPTGWTQQARLIADNATTRDNFGSFVGVSGNYVVIGTGTNDGQDPDPQPAAYLYTYSANAWSQSGRVPIAANGVVVAMDGNRFMTGNNTSRLVGTVHSFLIIPEPATGLQVLIAGLGCLLLRRPK